LEGIEIGSNYLKDTLSIEALQPLLSLNNLKLIPYRARTFILAPEKEANYLQSDTSHLFSFIKAVDSTNEFYFFSGSIIDQQHKKPIQGATVQNINKTIGTISDSLGRFELKLKAGKQKLIVSMLGFKQQEIYVQIQKNTQKQITLLSDANELKEVMIMGETKDGPMKVAEIGKTKVNLQSLKKLPSFMGETDVIKSVLMLPGVSNVGEGATGFLSEAAA
jgi:hypothetical protein